MNPRLVDGGVQAGGNRYDEEAVYECVSFLSDIGRRG